MAAWGSTDCNVNLSIRILYLVGLWGIDKIIMFVDGLTWFTAWLFTAFFSWNKIYGTFAQLQIYHFCSKRTTFN